MGNALFVRYKFEKNKLTIELIPVIEIGYNNQGVPVPDKYPYWNNPEVWDKFHEESYSKAGFSDKMTPYLPGSSFYKLEDISNGNLVKLTKDHTEDFRNGKYERSQMGAFFGGYVLRIDGMDKYFPQCCGDLADLTYWENLANGHPSYYEGHPAPRVEMNRNEFIFDFTVDEFEESFDPPPPDIFLTVDKLSLKSAIEKTKVALKTFAERLNKINKDENLGIDDIDKLLIWNNANHES
jgi:hypothetical protein